MVILKRHLLIIKIVLVILMAKLCVGSSKPTIKDNRLEKTGFLSFVSNTCKDFTEFAAVNYDKWDM
jgi:hypothetical protein